MQKAFDLIIDKIKEEKASYFLTIANTGDEKLDAIYKAVANAIDRDIEIVNQVAEEYKTELQSSVFDKITNFINSEIERTESFAEHDTQANIMHYVQQLQEEYKSTEHINCSTDTSISHRNSDLVIDSSHRNEEVCEWEYNRFEDGWQTDCCITFHLDVSESDLEIVKYCPYCGKKIKVV